MIDIHLARQLERAEGMANASFVDARNTVAPHIGAEWIEIAGALAMFDGPASPLTQTFGVGLFSPFLAREFDEVEAFFTTRGTPTSHEICTFAAHESTSLLGDRGYSPVEASVVLVRSTSGAAATHRTGPTVRRIDEAEVSTWSRISGEGWGSESPELAVFVEGFGAVIARTRGVTCFLAELDGAPIAAAALNITHGVALLAGAATVPAARKQGAQRALLEARLAFAVEAGIDLAMIVTQPGSASQRNAERQGFRPVYTRAKWQRGS
ncbi:MAG: GNAT family N-acetyltransferase [Gemmatimonadaceae bacterium]